MSKFQNIVKELKKFLADIPQEQEFNVSADDLVISEMKVGGKVEAKDAEGNVIPVPDGEYTVGEDVIVVKDGMIVSLNGETEEAPAEQMADDAPTDEPAKEDDGVQEKLDAMQKEIDELKASIESMKVEASKEETFSKQVEKLTDSIKMLMSMPAEFSKTNESIVVKDSKEQKIKEYARMLAESKNK